MTTRRSQRSSPQRILLIRTDRLGETVLHLPLLALLKRAFPSARIMWLVDRDLVDLLQHAPGADDVLGYEKTAGVLWWQAAGRLARQLRKWQVDTVLISNPTKAFHLASWLARVPRRIGYDHKWAWTLTRRLPDEKAHGIRHEVECHLDLLKALGAPITDIPPLHLPVSFEDQQWASACLGRASGKPQRWVAVHPWTSNPAKQWPLDHFRALILHLQHLPGVGVIMIGGAEEQGRAAAMCPEDGAGVLNVVGRTSLRQLAAVLQHSRVLISNDSGPVHLAAAVNTPVVALSIMVFFALCCQCGATLATIKRETGSWGYAVFTFTYMTSLAYLGALAVYQIGSHLV